MSNANLPHLPGAPDLDAQPSPCLLFYLFSDRLGLKSPLAGEVHVPCSQASVRPLDLASLLFAVAIWELLECRAIEISLQKQRFAFFFSSNVAAIRSTGGLEQLLDMPDHAFAHSIGKTLEANGGQSDASTLVHNWYRPKMQPRQNFVFMGDLVAVNMVKGEGVALGLIDYISDGTNFWGYFEW